MICKKTCTLVAAFLSASLAHKNFVDKTNLSKDLKDSLSKEKKHIYEEIQKNVKTFISQDYPLVCIKYFTYFT